MRDTQTICATCGEAIDRLTVSEQRAFQAADEYRHLNPGAGGDNDGYYYPARDGHAASPVGE